MEEKWKDIDGTNGLYQVSDLGRIARVRSYGRRILKPTFGSISYPTVHITFGNKRRRCTIHRLVAIAFIPNPDGLPQVNHKDENPANSSATNLEWCTEIYNHRYGTCRERGHAKISHRITFLGVEYNSIRECSRITGRDRRFIKRNSTLIKQEAT